jgi:hypothetical protein
MASSPARWAVAAVALGLSAAGPSAHAEPGDDLTVSALTFGPGDHPFFKFGHNAILVQKRDGPGWVFNFGTFAFDSPALLPKFLRGSFKYWLSVSSIEETIASYAAANRSILAQELDLTVAQKWALWQALRENARPENREYLYDYFYDNCSTRVRDAIDRVVDGRVRAAGQGAAQMTFRAHSLRMVADLWPEYVGLYLGLGRAADVPINRWNESFLPERLADLLRAVRLPDGRGLVRSETILHRAVRPAKPAAPPDWTAYFLGIGLLLGGLVLLLGRLARRFLVARIALGSAVSAVGGCLGLLGMVLVCLWAFTNHRAAHANANIMQLAPWAVVLLAYGIGVARGRPRAVRRSRFFVLLAAGFSVLGIVCKALPGANQDSWPILLFCLPLWLGLLGGLEWLARSTSSAPPAKPRTGKRR